MKSFIKRIFNVMDKGYFARAYIFGAIFCTIFLIQMIQIVKKEGLSGNRITFILIFIFQWLFFPFAKVAWDTIRDFLAGGNNTYLIPIVLLFMVKMFINAFLYTFSIIIAPIGIFFLYRASKKMEQNIENQNK